MIKCNFKKETETAKMPTMHTQESAGIDFYSDDEFLLLPGQSKKVSLGVSWNPKIMKDDIDFYFNIALIIQSRSGWAFKYQIESSNAGVIDQDYITTKKHKAIIHALLYNNGNSGKYINKGDKICQGVLQLVPKVLDVQVLDESRDGQGFGSSDRKVLNDI